MAARERGDAQLFGQSRTLRAKQLLGFDCSMANLDLAAPNADILPKRRFSCPFAGLLAQLQPVAEIAPDPRQRFVPLFSRSCSLKETLRAIAFSSRLKLSASLATKGQINVISYRELFIFKSPLMVDGT